MAQLAESAAAILDETGSIMPSPTGEPFFAPGPLFANLVLGDEINRSPSKTQAAAPEAMEERQITVDGVSHPLPTPFFLLATQNPIETEGTYPLPEAQLDRFLMRISVSYPTPQDERELLRRRIERGQEQPELRTVVSAEQVAAMPRAVEQVTAESDVVDYVVSIVEATRAHDSLEVGASPRGGLALLRAARAAAALAGRSFTTPDDVKSLALPVLAHSCFAPRPGCAWCEKATWWNNAWPQYPVRPSLPSPPTGPGAPGARNPQGHRKRAVVPQLAINSTVT